MQGRVRKEKQIPQETGGGNGCDGLYGIKLYIKLANFMVCVISHSDKKWLSQSRILCVTINACSLLIPVSVPFGTPSALSCGGISPPKSKDQQQAASLKLLCKVTGPEAPTGLHLHSFFPLQANTAHSFSRMAFQNIVLEAL